MAGALSPASALLMADLVAASRTLGGDPTLVLHGGGNTSVKATWTDVTGRDRPALLIKGSGHDLATIDADGFTPLDLKRLRELLPPVDLHPDDLAGELRCAQLRHPAPEASVETLVHAVLPHTAVLHSHADAILTLTNTADGARRMHDLYGRRVVVVDYEMPGPALARACAAAWDGAADRQDEVEGLVVLQHGLFTVGRTPAEALARHLDLVALARAAAGSVGGPVADDDPAHVPDVVAVARLRRALSDAAGRPLVVTLDASAEARAFAADDALVAAARRGPLTPDHVLWTGPFPQVGDDVEGHAVAHRSYLTGNAERRGVPVPDVDAAARVVVDPRAGVLAAGRTAREAGVVRDIAAHTRAAVRAAEALGGYRPADPAHVFDLDTWGAQRAKLGRAARSGDLTGRVAVVTGAASGIGRACAAALLEAGATVIGWDVSASVTTTFDTPEWLGLVVDVTAPGAQADALARGVAAFGGLDVLVVSAGIFPTAQHLDGMDLAMWRRTMSINVDSVAELYGLAHPLLALSPGGGRVVVIASKNVAAPGPGAAAYSASKAALTQLSRVAALEWASDGVRVNLVHPDAVFDTALWTPELLEKRAGHYGMSIEEYKRRNLLRTEVTSVAVGRLVRSMADETFACTTGAQVPIDGGNERVI
ncbi:SDR family oxidoreductase [Cellulomonas fengjieae]|uniref:SDR family oxidoreductase n=1 Tax=Cellulomonas fengjieae TaxID=2819978 RepID=UPI001AAF89BC|nr:SDR family oxidoreductase [Cellulomonas fengjieae]MBO3102178.1 SDR family oxidoreductase [Cellulomonas fengjieae]